MAKNFILLETGAIAAGASANLRVIPLPSDLTLTIEDIEIFSPVGSAAGASTFNLRAGSSIGSLATIFSSPTDRPVLASGATEGRKSGLSIGLPAGGWLALDADSIPLGGLPAPVFCKIRVEDGTATAGPPGAPGADGADGADGAPGAAGAAGQGFTYRGEWASGTAYAAYDVVAYNGSTYLAIASSTGVLPSSDVTKWAVMAASANALAGEQDLAWAGLVNATVDANNTLLSSASGGAQAVQTITGIGGEVRFKVGAPSESTRYFGLRTTTPDHTAGNFKYYLQARLDGTLQVWENPGTGLVNVVMGVAYIALDELQFECFDSGGGAAQIRIRQNGVVRATFTLAAPSFPLYFDVQLAFDSQHVYEAKIKSTA